MQAQKGFPRADKVAKNDVATDLLIVTVFTIRMCAVYFVVYQSRDCHRTLPKIHASCTESLIIFLTICDLRLPCMIQISLVAEQEGGEIGWQA